MSLSRYPQITDDLLSAYVDNEASQEEIALIERAILDDPEIAWRLESFQQTVQLLRELPEVALPRSFALTAAMVDAAALRNQKEQTSTNLRVGELVRPSEQTYGWWRQLVATFQAGNPYLGGMAAAVALLFVILVARAWLVPSNGSTTDAPGQNFTGIRQYR